MKSKKYRIIIILLCSVIGLLLIFISTLTAQLYKTEPLELSEKISIGYDGKMESSDDNEKTNLFYGIRVVIFWDYEQCPKYIEWLEMYGLKNCSSKEEKLQNNYYKTLNDAFYETIKDDYGKLEYRNNEYSSSIWLLYSFTEPKDETIKESKKKMNKIKNSFFKSKYYKNLVSLSQEKYIYSIMINIYNPARYEDYEWPSRW